MMMNGPEISSKAGRTADFDLRLEAGVAERTELHDTLYPGAQNAARRVILGSGTRE